jgi:hypothetical protein
MNKRMGIQMESWKGRQMGREMNGQIDGPDERAKWRTDDINLIDNLPQQVKATHLLAEFLRWWVDG